MQVGQGNELQLATLDMGRKLPPQLQAGAQEAAKAAPALLGFQYFKGTEAAERKLEATPDLAALDRACQQVKPLACKLPGAWQQKHATWHCAAC